jgi:hypothetical protein
VCGTRHALGSARRSVLYVLRDWYCKRLDCGSAWPPPAGHPKRCGPLLAPSPALGRLSVQALNGHGIRRALQLILSVAAHSKHGHGWECKAHSPRPSPPGMPHAMARAIRPGRAAPRRTMIGPAKTAPAPRRPRAAPLWQCPGPRQPGVRGLGRAARLSPRLASGLASGLAPDCTGSSVPEDDGARED